MTQYIDVITKHEYLQVGSINDWKSFSKGDTVLVLEGLMDNVDPIDTIKNIKGGSVLLRRLGEIPIEDDICKVVKVILQNEFIEIER